jgi:hypothetical protein
MYIILAVIVLVVLLIVAVKLWLLKARREG